MGRVWASRVELVGSNAEAGYCMLRNVCNRLADSLERLRLLLGMQCTLIDHANSTSRAAMHTSTHH